MSAGAIRRWIAVGVLALVAIMPFHAFLTITAGSITGHRAWWQGWKEALLLLLVAGGAYLLARQPQLVTRFKAWWFYLAISYALMSLVVTLITRPPLEAVALGIKYNLTMLAAAAAGALVASVRLERLVIRVILITSAMVAAFGLLQVWVLPVDWLKAFGYGSGTIAPFRLVDPAIDAVRIISTLSGPNQLGSFLILPLCLSFYLGLRQRQWWQWLLFAALSLTLVNTYSRSAWLGAAAALTILAVLLLPRAWRLAAGGGIVLAGGLGLMLLLQNPSVLGGKGQYYLLHNAQGWYSQRGSDAERLDGIGRGLKSIVGRPLGQGLGTAGPASKSLNQPQISENYYLQLGIESGVAGLALFLALTAAVGWGLWQRRASSSLALPLLATLAGISVINLFLHGWADSSTALIWWTSAGVALGQNT